MKKIVMLIVCLVLVSVAADVEETHIPASAVVRGIATEPIHFEAKSFYTGKTSYPPWLIYGRDAPWSTDVLIPDVYSRDDQLLSMAEDALGQIYVCYDAISSAAPLRYALGIAWSSDSGQTWNNIVYYSSTSSICHNEIAITDDGKIYAWGSYTGSGYTNIPVVMRSHIGGYNRADTLYGWDGWAFPDRVYGECVTWGDGHQFVSTQYTVDHSGTDDDSVCMLFSRDSISGGSIWYFNFRPSGGYPGMTSLALDITGTGDTIWIHGIDYYDAGGSDWDVVWYLDTLNGSGSFWGWATTNPGNDRYPSVFSSQGYSYLAYLGDVGDPYYEDILFNYSTDYGASWAGIVDLTTDPATESYPRLYGDGSTIGLVYVYDFSTVHFNYSLDNGQTWLSSPEKVNDGTTVNENYHSASLLHTSAYWHAAWEDTRNSGTDGLEIFASRRIMGQGDITHRPAEISFNYNTFGSGRFSSEKYVIRHAVNPVDKKLAEVIAESSPNEFIPIFVMLAKQMNPEYLIPRAEQMSKPERRQFVVRECQALANEDQKALLSYLRRKESEGQVLDIATQWSTNTVHLKARPTIIREIANRNDVWEIGFSEPLQIIDAHKTEKPAYKKIEFVPEYGRADTGWGVKKINAPAVWGIGYTGAGVIVGHMDSGVNYNHTDLSDHMWTNPDEIRGNGIDDDGNGYIDDWFGYDFVSGDSLPMDEDDHGTWTAGIIAGDGTSGSNTGVAPDARIMALRIYPGGSAEMGEAIDYVLLDTCANLLSCSIGWPNPSNSIKNWCRGEAIAIYGAGIVWCVAAGNGAGGGSHYSVPQDVITPADCPGPWYAPNGGNSASIAVGATDQSDSVANFSSYGPTHWNTGTYNDYPYPPGLMKPDVAAPGVGCKSLRRTSNNQYDTNLDGTSFAQPHHAGTVALMLERQPLLSPRQIDSLIQITAVDIEAAGRDSLSGMGRIDALQAVNAISEGARWAQLWVINQASATGILQVTDITKDSSWIISVEPKQFTVPINDSQSVWVTVDTTGQGLTWGNTYYDTLDIWSNSVFDANPEKVPVELIMALIGTEEKELFTSLENAQLLSAAPNPFRNAVTIDYSVSHSLQIECAIYDVCGKKVRTLIDKVHEPGHFSIMWNGKDDTGRTVSAGVYFCRIEADKNAMTNKVILIR